MDEKELLKERFKSAVSSTVKAISENFDLKIKFGGNLSSKENSLNSVTCLLSLIPIASYPIKSKRLI